MEYRQNCDSLAERHIKNRVRETAHERTPNLLMDNRELLRVRLNFQEGGLHTFEEIVSQAGPLLLIPPISVSEV